MAKIKKAKPKNKIVKITIRKDKSLYVNQLPQGVVLMIFEGKGIQQIGGEERYF